MSTPARGCLFMWSMKHYLFAALITLFSLLPARAQLQFSDSVRVSLLVCSAGPDAYERFGHVGIRLLDQRNPGLDVTFDYGVFSFDAPHFVYRFVKGETDYQLGARYTEDFIRSYQGRGLGMTQQWLRLDSAQTQDLIERLLINYEPQNRTYRYSFFFDNCSTRPYHLLNATTDNTIKYDTAWVHDLTLREQVQEKTNLNNWLDFGIALAVAGRADRIASFEEQLFLPEYLGRAIDNAEIPVAIGKGLWYEPLVTSKETLLTMRPEVAAQIAAPDPISPAAVCASVLLLGIIVSAWEWRRKRRDIVVNTYDTLVFLVIGITGLIVWFLNFFSVHPAVDHNLNILWVVPTHVIVAVLLWFKKMDKVCQIYFGIIFAMVILYVILDWIYGQYCPSPFLLLLALILLRSYMRTRIYNK